MRQMTLLAVCAIVCLSSVVTMAQTPEPSMVRLIPDLLRDAALIDKGPTAVDQSAHFQLGLQSMRAPDELNRALAWELASFPMGPTSGDVVFSKGATGTEGPRAFGSGYGRSALTLPRGRYGLAFAYQTTTFSTLDDVDLTASDVNLYIEHVPGPTDESRDLMQETLSLHLNRKVFSFIVNYGLTSRLEVGAVVPIVQVAADARVTARILRTATASTPSLHEFAPGSDVLLRPDIDLGNRTLYRSSTARGVGDIVMRGKFNLMGGGGGSALAVGVDLRLPTGSVDEFIGLGATQVTPAVVWSGSFGRVAPRARVQYTWSKGELSSQLVDRSVPDEIGFSAGFDAPVVARTTLVVDLMGRRATNVMAFQSGTTVFPSRGPGPLPSAAFTARNDFGLGHPRTITQVLGSVGARFDLGRATYANVGVLFPTSHEGLRPLTMAVFSIARGF